MMTVQSQATHRAPLIHTLTLFQVSNISSEGMASKGELVASVPSLGGFP